ncbi:hypothetical protein MUDAN_DOGOELCO_03302 [Lactiplantibacillus mudanjiangensis]|uniref:hypothetical protein n=1 Tax=Lactiplantibacillus mudanjiangensis TaxID=1296538 RepID=UPI001015C046|nr:hypothetical protein [Lactiplantibacillus mudanjiangensis]VDG31458.1 hypothetical protein MUDAN_DOGOELCO_03302 [Lactiplantibacillus mudanjiangensis]
MKFYELRKEPYLAVIAAESLDDAKMTFNLTMPVDWDEIGVIGHEVTVDRAIQVYMDLSGGHIEGALTADDIKHISKPMKIIDYGPYGDEADD